MRAPALLVLSGLVLGAAACAGVEPTPPVSPLPAPGGAPPPLEGHDWFYHPDGDAARLVYGTPESDDMKLGVRLRPRLGPARGRHARRPGRQG